MQAKHITWFLMALFCLPAFATATDQQALPDEELLEFLGQYNEADEYLFDIALDDEQDTALEEKNSSTFDREDGYE